MTPCFETPETDVCLDGLATTDAQEEVAPPSARYRDGRRRDGPCEGCKTMNEETFAWFVGIDWGSEKHQDVFSISRVPS